MSELEELRARWDERDRRYSMRKQGGLALPLSDDEQFAIRTWRYQEANALQPGQSEFATAEVFAWSPPMVVR